MIQRIQSILLFLAALIASLLYFPAFAFVSATPEVAKAGIWSDGRFDTYDNTGLLILVGGIAVISLITLFLYGNRVLQIKMTYLIIFLVIGTLGIVAWILYQNTNLSDGSKLPITVNPGLFVPVVVAILIVYARRFIRKDEKTVRSMDRLR